MPKSFTESERAQIRNRLIEEAQDCLARYGMRKTTVDELTRRVNIPKGTFYLFYDSKELLFFDVFRTLHDSLKTELLSKIKALEGNVTTDTVSGLIFDLYRDVDATFLYRFAAGGDLELLVRKLPPETAASHALEDDFSMEQLLSLLPGVRTEENVKTVSAVLRAVFCTMLHRREIGEEVFYDAVKILLRGAIAQLFEGAVL